MDENIEAMGTGLVDAVILLYPSPTPLASQQSYMVCQGERESHSEFHGSMRIRI